MREKKELDFEVNLLPIISLLAVLICFLLLTAVWVQYGSQNLNFAYGKTALKKTSSVISAQLDSSNNIFFYISGKNNKVIYKKTIKSKNTKINFKYLNRTLKKITKKRSYKTAVISPSGNTSYQDIIKIMDMLKASSITDVGIGTI